MKLKIINKLDGYLMEFTGVDRGKITVIEFDNSVWQSRQFKGRHKDLKGPPKQGSGNEDLVNKI